MTVGNEEQLDRLKHVGQVVAVTLKRMATAIEPGMTTRQLDALGRELLSPAGAQSAPESRYRFPGATCISVAPAIAHGIPGDQVMEPGGLVNIDVSAEIDGYFADTGASVAIPPINPRTAQLCRDGKRALWTGIRAV